MKTFLKKIKRSNLFKEYLLILNGSLQLSDKEMEVLSILMAFDTNWVSLAGEPKNVINSYNRDLIMKEFNMSSSNLSKYIAKLKNKKLLVMNKDYSFEVRQDFIPKLEDDMCHVTFVLDAKENN